MKSSKLNNQNRMKSCGKACAALAVIFFAGTAFSAAASQATYKDANDAPQTVDLPAADYDINIISGGTNISELAVSFEAAEFVMVSVQGSTISGDSNFTGTTSDNGGMIGITVANCTLAGGTWKQSISKGSADSGEVYFQLGDSTKTAHVTVNSGTKFLFEGNTTNTLTLADVTWRLDKDDLGSALIKGTIDNKVNFSIPAAGTVTLALTQEAFDAITKGESALQLFDANTAVIQNYAGAPLSLSLTVDGTSVEDSYSASVDNTGMVTVSQVPEPSAFGLLAGLSALAIVASRRRRK